MIRFLQTPGPVKKIILSTMLLIICGAMVITLIPGGLGNGLSCGGGPGVGVVAKVGSEDVTRVEVASARPSKMQQQFPRGSAMASQLLPYFASQAVQQLIIAKRCSAKRNAWVCASPTKNSATNCSTAAMPQRFSPTATLSGRTRTKSGCSKRT